MTTKLSKCIIYYTDNRLEESIAERVREQLKLAKLPIVSVSLKPLKFGQNITLPLERSYKTMFRQILTALQASTADVVYFCEHDVLYPKEHFDFVPPDMKFYYDINWWKVRKDGLAVHWDAAQVSGLVCDRRLAIAWYKARIETYTEESFDRKFEPTIDTTYETWWCDVPHIDIRHDRNLTYNKWKLEHFRKKDTAVNFQQSIIDEVPGWNLTAKDIY